MSTVSFKYPLQTLSIGPMVCFTLDIIRLDGPYWRIFLHCEVVDCASLNFC